MSNKKVQMSIGFNEYKIFFDNSPIALTISYDLRFIYFNQKFRELLNIPDTIDHNDLGPRDFLPPNSADLVQERMRTVKENPAVTMSFQWDALTYDGKPIILESTVRSIPYLDDIAVIVYVEDKTEEVERRNLEQKEHAILEEIKNKAPHPMIIYNDDFSSVIFSNDATERLLGWSQEELLEMDLSSEEFVPPIPHDEIQIQDLGNDTIKQLENKGSAIIDYKQSTKDGKVLDIRTYIVRLNVTGNVIYMAFLIDQTELLKSREFLEFNEKLFLAINDSDPDGISLYDMEAKQIIYVNDAYAKVHRREKHEMIAMDPLDPSFTPEFQPNGVRSEDQLKKNFKDLMEKGHGDPEWTNLDPDGNPIHFRVSALMINYGNRKLIRAIKKDITELKKMEDAFRHVVKMEATSRMAAGITHDFNNMLTVILGQAEVLSQKLQDESLKSYIKQIIGVASQSSSMIERLQLFSLEQDLKEEESDPNEIILDSMKLLTPILGKSIELRYQLQDELPTVMVDQFELQNSLVNLVFNSKDAIGRDGLVEIRTYAEKFPSETLPPLLIPLNKSSDEVVVIEVSDDGPGIPSHLQPRIFEPYFTTKPTGKGTGLGLASVYGFMKKSKGSITFSSGSNGTTFYLLFPANS